jgi:hypothetical protein
MLENTWSSINSNRYWTMIELGYERRDIISLHIYIWGNLRISIC